MDLTSIKDAATDEYFKQPVVVSCSTQCVCVCVCVCVLRSVCNILLRMAYNTVYIESMEHATCCINEMGSSGVFSRT